VKGGDGTDALEEYVRAPNDPRKVQAHVLRGNALVGLRSFEEALEAIEEAIRLDPGRGSTFAQLAPDATTTAEIRRLFANAT